MPTRRTVLQMGALATLGVAGAELAPASADSGSGGLLAARNTPVPFAGVFVRPPELTPFETGFDGGDPTRPFARFEVTAQLGRAQILPGLTTTIAGYNGIFPGPTIRTTQGTRAEVRFRNGFPGAGLIFPQSIDISTHLHGSESLPQYDGYANDITRPAFVKNYRYPNSQRAATLWYHDHRHLVTAQNVYSGLAGFYPLTDPFERAQLPQDEFDVPLMISDALFNADGSLRFDDNGTKGLWGNIILVNGVPWPTMRSSPASTGSALSSARSHGPTAPPCPTAIRSTSWRPTMA